MSFSAIQAIGYEPYDASKGARVNWHHNVNPFAPQTTSVQPKGQGLVDRLAAFDTPAPSRAGGSYDIQDAGRKLSAAHKLDFMA